MGGKAAGGWLVASRGQSTANGPGLCVTAVLKCGIPLHPGVPRVVGVSQGLIMPAQPRCPVRSACVSHFHAPRPHGHPTKDRHSPMPDTSFRPPGGGTLVSSSQYCQPGVGQRSFEPRRLGPGGKGEVLPTGQPEQVPALGSAARTGRWGCLVVGPPRNRLALLDHLPPGRARGSHMSLVGQAQCSTWSRVLQSYNYGRRHHRA